MKAGKQISAPLIVFHFGSVFLLSYIKAIRSESVPGVEIPETLPWWGELGDIILIALLVTCSGLAAGLTLGLLSLDLIGLEIIIAGGDEDSSRNAQKIKPVREEGNLLLCTLLFANVALNAALSILTAHLTSNLIGFLVSTLLILVFAEILPMSVCGRHALAVGARAAPTVKVLMVALYPVCKPFALCLDFMLGEEIGTIHSRQELMKLLEIHVQHGSLDTESGQILGGALEYKSMQVKDAMTPIEEVFYLSEDDVLDFRTVARIFKSGFSRIPVAVAPASKQREKSSSGWRKVFSKSSAPGPGAGGEEKGSAAAAAAAAPPADITRVLFAKDLLFLDPEDATPLRGFLNAFGRPLMVVWPNTRLDEVLAQFKRGHHGHLAIVKEPPPSGAAPQQVDPRLRTLGIITLEDVLEKILGDDINDETDSNHGDVDQKASRSSTPSKRSNEKNIFSETDLAERKQSIRQSALDFQRVLAAGQEEGGVAPCSEEEARAVASYLCRPGALAPAPIGAAAGAATGGLGLDYEQAMYVAINAPTVTLQGGSGYQVYRRGKITTVLTLVLEGVLTVEKNVRGKGLKGGTISKEEAGAWTAICVGAACSEEGTFVADADVIVASSTVRFLQISRSMVVEAQRLPHLRRRFSDELGPVGLADQEADKKTGKRASGEIKKKQGDWYAPIKSNVQRFGIGKNRGGSGKNQGPVLQQVNSGGGAVLRHLEIEGKQSSIGVV